VNVFGAFREATMVPTKLLLVDDEEDFVSALAERLRFRHFDTRVATSGEAGLKEIQKERPDIVLLDYRMPGLDGTETLTEIRAKYPSIDVIIVTGGVDGEVGEESLKAGATDYVVKPVDIEILMDKLQDIREKRGLG
jgi:DNA-binding response OmpR family regulator